MTDKVSPKVVIAQAANTCQKMHALADRLSVTAANIKFKHASAMNKAVQDLNRQKRREQRALQNAGRICRAGATAIEATWWLAGVLHPTDERKAAVIIAAGTDQVLDNQIADAVYHGVNPGRILPTEG